MVSRLSPGCQCCEAGIECTNCTNNAWNMQLTITGFANTGSEHCTPCTDFNQTIELTPTDDPGAAECIWALDVSGTCFDYAEVRLDAGGNLNGQLLGPDDASCGFGRVGYTFTVNLGTPPVNCQTISQTGLSVSANFAATNCGPCNISSAAVDIAMVEP